MAGVVAIETDGIPKLPCPFGSVAVKLEGSRIMPLKVDRGLSSIFVSVSSCRNSSSLFRDVEQVQVCEVQGVCKLERTVEALGVELPARAGEVSGEFFILELSGDSVSTVDRLLLDRLHCAWSLVMVSIMQ
jgi:hypothetical protein